MNTSSRKTEKAKVLLQEALNGVRQANLAWADFPLDFTTEEELASFGHELEQMLESINTGKARDVPGLWRIVIDMWPYTNQLRQKIVDAELAFEELH